MDIFLGTCYKKVKEETEAMRAAMDENDRLLYAPQKEVVFLYEGEEKEQHNGKYIVEIKRGRPEWFSKNLLTKGQGRYS